MAKGANKRLKNGLTIKQQKFTDIVIKQISNGESPNLTEAAAQVYDVKERDSASAIGTQNFQNLTIREQIDTALERTGLTSSKVVDNLAKLANAVPEKYSDATILKANLAVADLLGWQLGNKMAGSFKKITRTVTFDEAKKSIVSLTESATEFITEAEA